MKVVLELPLWRSNCGGLIRFMKLAQELPHFNAKSGGITESIKMCEKIIQEYDIEVHVRFQKTFENEVAPIIPGVSMSLGMPNQDFPKCDVGITYSDTPFIDEFAALPQIKRKFAFMLSYGMAIHRERKVALHPGVSCMSTTRRTQRLIEAEGGKCHWVGFGFENEKWFPNPSIIRKPYASILYHPQAAKRYKEAVAVVDRLYNEGRIEGVLTFGMIGGYEKAIKPKGLIRHIVNASQEEVRDIFSESMVFIMPSTTEGLNLTPIEATLCGCPAVLCDGAIGEIFFDKQNCMVSSFDVNEVYNNTNELIRGWIHYGPTFYDFMKGTIQDYTWDRHIERILEFVS